MELCGLIWTKSPEALINHNEPEFVVRYCLLVE